MDRLENGAAPASAGNVVVLDGVPPPGLVPMAIVMLAVELVAVLPNASCTVTCTAGEIGAPAFSLVGCALKTTRLAAAWLMVNPAEVAPVRAPEVAASV